MEGEPIAVGGDQFRSARTFKHVVFYGRMPPWQQFLLSESICDSRLAESRLACSSAAADDSQKGPLTVLPNRAMDVRGRNSHAPSDKVPSALRAGVARRSYR